jgi:hypothetical protein
VKYWSAQDWAEWRAEREGILIYDAGFAESDAVEKVKRLEAMEKHRAALERAPSAKR